MEDVALSAYQDCHASAEIANLTLESSVQFEVSTVVWTMVALASFWSAMQPKCRLSPNTFTCAFKPGCPMSRIWLPTPDCKLHCLYCTDLAVCNSQALHH